MKTNLYVSVAIVFAISASNLIAQQDWKLAKEVDGVKVYLRDHKGSKIKEFKAVTEFQNASITNFYSIFKDGNQTSKWSYAVDYSKILAQPTLSDDIVYYQVNTPWPLQKRDVIQKQSLSWGQNGQELVSVSYSIPDYLPKKQGFTRVEESSVKWTFKQTANGNVDVEYEFYTNPKIPIPDNIVQYFIVNGPVFVFEKLREHYYNEYQTFGRVTK